MKRYLKYYILTVIASLGIVAVTVYSCEKENIIPNEDNLQAENPMRFITERDAVCGKFVEKVIVGPDHKEVGKAIVYNDEKYFYIIMTSNRSFYFQDAYMHICDRLAEIPLNSGGNPNLALYEYSILNKPTSNVRKFRIPLEEISTDNLISVGIETIVKRQSQGGSKRFYSYIDGKFIGNEKPGRVFSYEIQVCLIDDGITESINE